jgi:hypothetical protein
MHHFFFFFDKLANIKELKCHFLNKTCLCFILWKRAHEFAKVRIHFEAVRDVTGSIFESRKKRAFMTQKLEFSAWFKSDDAHEKCMKSTRTSLLLLFVLTKKKKSERRRWRLEKLHFLTNFFCELALFKM